LTAEGVRKGTTQHSQALGRGESEYNNNNYYYRLLRHAGSTQIHTQDIKTIKH